LGFVDFFRHVTLQVGLGIVAVATRNDCWNFHCRMGEFPVTPLAAGNECKSGTPKVFEEITDFAWLQTKLRQPI
jgi:hypothetical protein